jgi:hypothetical protein
LSIFALLCSSLLFFAILCSSLFIFLFLTRIYDLQSRYLNSDVLPIQYWNKYFWSSVQGKVIIDYYGLLWIPENSWELWYLVSEGESMLYWTMKCSSDAWNFFIIFCTLLCILNHWWLALSFKMRRVSLW